MANILNLFKPLKTSLEVSALSYSLQQTGMPKDQADAYAKQQLLKQPPVQIQQADMGFGSLLTPMNLALGGLAIVGIIFLVKRKPAGKRR